MKPQFLTKIKENLQLIIIGIITVLTVGCSNNDMIKDFEVVENISTQDVNLEIDFTSQEYKDFLARYLNNEKEISSFFNKMEYEPVTEEFIRDQYKGFKLIEKSFKERGLDVNNISETELDEVFKVNDVENVSFKKVKSSKYFSTSLPFYSQFDKNENPNRYLWCGHTVLKCVAKKHGSFKKLNDIHNAFIRNSKEYANQRCNNDRYCASMADLLWASINPNGGSWNYNFPNTDVDNRYEDLPNWYRRLKEGVIYNKPAIVASKFKYSIGHFYPVMGIQEYYNPDGSIDYDKTQVILRDVVLSNQKYSWGDIWTSAKNFYNNRITKQILFVRP